MDKNYWKAKSWFLVLALSLLILFPVGAQESLSSYFVKITDASKAVKNGNQSEAQKLVTEMASDFERIEDGNSEAGKVVKEKLAQSGEITEDKLTEISSALLAFEKEQNPVDLDAEKEKLVNRLSPRFEALEQAIASKDLEKVREACKKMNFTWTINESVVRDNSTAHYGRVETAISFLRSSMETAPTDFNSIQTSFDDLKKAIDDFVTGKEVAERSSDLSLKDGIALLKKALEQFQAGDQSSGAASIKEFITICSTIEGSVSMTNPSLYTRVESESPVIMVKGSEKEYQEKLEKLIADLSQIDTSARYNAFDAMLILLREGVEVLLIVIALVTILKAAKMQKGLK